jgi:hypothetical protein
VVVLVVKEILKVLVVHQLLLVTQVVLVVAVIIAVVVVPQQIILDQLNRVFLEEQHLVQIMAVQVAVVLVQSVGTLMAHQEAQAVMD